MMRWCPILLLCPVTEAFVSQQSAEIPSSPSITSIAPSSTTSPTTRSTRLFGISEWRDFTSVPSKKKETTATTAMPPKPLCVLPFPCEEVLLQGETKQLRLYEDRFLKLFDDVMDNHHGVLGMGLLAGNEGIIETIPVCEVEAYNRMVEGFGIFVTIRVIGRARITELAEMEPYLKVVCEETFDEPINPNESKELNWMADEIENSVQVMTRYEMELNNLTDDDDDDDDEDYDDDDEKDDSDRYVLDDDDEDDDLAFNRMARFREACKTALQFDSQGYTTSSSSPSGLRSVQELTALSWAVFCTDVEPHEADFSLRMQALDSEDLKERLRLGGALLRRQIRILEQALESQAEGDGDDDEDDDEAFLG